MRLDGEKVERVAQLAQALPLQLINPDAFRLLEGSPSARREFLDWGVFHVKHDFFDVWRRVRRALKHRNALLRHGKMDVQALNVWDREFAHWSERLDALRMEYMQALAPLFQATLAELIDLPELTLRYQRGWDAKRPLGDVLAAGRDSDSHMGFTQTGPQRADLRIRLGRRPAVEVLSRGQQKLVVSALKLAQGRLLEEMNGRTCVYLIDDLPAELDGEHRRLFCQLLAGLECQVFVTCVEPETLDRVWLPNTDVRMFHVEHGRLHTE
jgi:DNA replication and repair protein RecF|tara:strand:- start:93 stop:896 length:804 start_codon:yes stop_codon:yes gene_type:complete